MGLENFPFSKFSSNSVWLMVVMLAQDLLAWASVSAWRATGRSRAQAVALRPLAHSRAAGAHRPAADLAPGCQLALGPLAGSGLPAPGVPAPLLTARSRPASTT